MSKDRNLTSLRQELDNIQNLNASVNYFSTYSFVIGTFYRLLSKFKNLIK